MRVLKLVVIFAVTMAIWSCVGVLPKASDKVTHLTVEDFDSKVANLRNNEEWKYLGDKPAIIDFYAIWCPPCKKIAPILEELAEEYDGRVEIYKVDTDVELELASAFNISSIPTLLFIPMSGKPEIVTGAISKDEFVKRIEKMLAER